MDRIFIVSSCNDIVKIPKISKKRPKRAKKSQKEPKYAKKVRFLNSNNATKRVNTFIFSYHKINI